MDPSRTEPLKTTEFDPLPPAPRPLDAARPNGFWTSIWTETGQPLSRYLLHCITGTVLFVLIAGAALGLELFIKWLEHHGMGRWQLLGLQIVEGAVLTMDAIGYMVFLGRVTYKMLKNLW